MLEGDNWHVVEPREIHVLDRIGGGDGFVGGMLYAILKGWEPEKWIQFGWATGALATTVSNRLWTTCRRRTGVEHLERKCESTQIIRGIACIVMLGIVACMQDVLAI